MLLKRIDSEIRQWTEADRQKMGDLVVEDVDACLMRVGSLVTLSCKGYPFRAPHIVSSASARHRGVSCGTQRSLEPVPWLLSVASHPPLLKGVPIFRVDCFCCHSVTCPSNWTPACRIALVAHEVLFQLRYADAILHNDGRLLFDLLSHELLEHVASFFI